MKTIVDRIRRDPRCESIADEGDDGWWVMLRPGYCWPEGETHAVHERDLESLWREFRTVAPCRCNDCTR